MNRLILIAFGLLYLSSCTKKEARKEEKVTPPVVSNSGDTITFPTRQSTASFGIEKIGSGNITAEFKAPGKIAATIVSSGEGAAQNIVLFENPELAGNYTQLIQHQININQIQNINIRKRQIELDRINDLHAHGAATGQDLLNAQTAQAMEQSNLANEKAAMIEHESKLVSAGFNPDMLRKARAGSAYLICDIPESQISKIREGNQCNINFTAFPNEEFKGKVDHIADVMDNVTRMVKLRISLNNSSSKLKAGMFATVSFGLSEGNFISIPKTAMVTVQGENYAFLRNSPNSFQRVRVHPGQQIGDNMVIFSGLKDGDEIVTQGVMQLKGLSFGY